MDDDWDFSRPSTGPRPSPAFGANGPGFGAPGAGFGAPDPGGASPVGGSFGGPDAFPGTAPPLGGPLPIASPVGPPLVWLLTAVVAALLGLASAAVSVEGGALYLTGWALAGPIAIGLLTVFVRRDTARQTAMFYSYPTWKPLAYRVVLVLCLVAVVASALRIGDWVGHL